MGSDGTQQSSPFYELCALFLSLLRSPHLFFPSRRPGLSGLSPASLASLLLGAALSLMLCGSVTFVLGCILMPWVVGFVLLLYFVGVISSLSGIGKALFFPAAHSPARASPKEVSGERVLLIDFLFLHYQSVICGS
ncbi:hypothetical protein AXF42_Ash019539 [Apostasia shenzhenica]|uniref:Transmembrane protein n=1 Tax=Apostasia shenzhenica TaxID=1088818 RepID=A0A2I0A0D3_9ASPA|nr:hypothetical protein AXF42_Ash019539 [Apostasia shenzhenica]